MAQYRPLHGGSYMVLPLKLKNKKAILNIQNRDNQCLRWALQAALFRAPRGRNLVRSSRYPTENGLNFTGIDFPTLVSQIDRLERERDLLERHKPECKGLLKSPTRTEMPKAGENKMVFTNFYKQMKAP